MKVPIAKVEIIFGTLVVEKVARPNTPNQTFKATAQWPGTVAHGYGPTRTAAVDDVRTRHNLYLGNGKQEVNLNGIAS